MTSFFSIRRAVGLVLAAALWLMAGRAAAEALPLSPSAAEGGPFLRFSLSSAVDQWDGSVTADFRLWDGDRPVQKSEIEVLSAVCRCRTEGELHVLPLPVKEEEESAVLRLVLPQRASCSLITKLRYRGQLYVVQALRTIYARGRDPEDWPKATMPTDTPYLETASEEGYNFRTGRPMAFTFQERTGRPAAVPRRPLPRAPPPRRARRLPGPPPRRAPSRRGYRRTRRSPPTPAAGPVRNRPPGSTAGSWSAAPACCSSVLPSPSLSSAGWPTRIRRRSNLSPGCSRTARPD